MAQQPMYQQIADTIRGRIERGELEPGSQLPTELALRSEFNASRNTIRDAIKRLSDLNLVEARPGRGTFVKLKVDPFITRLSADPKTGFGGGEGTTYLSEVSAKDREPRTSQPRVEVAIPSPAVQKRLQLPAGTQIVLRHQQRFIDDVPWSLQTSFYPMDFIARGATSLLEAKNVGNGTVRYLANTIGVRQRGYQDFITVRQPDDNEQAFFKIAPESSVFELFRTAFDQNGNPMRVTVTVFPADRNQFIYDVGELPAPKEENLNPSPADEPA